jgi:hypothetical protein
MKKYKNKASQNSAAQIGRRFSLGGGSAEVVAQLGRQLSSGNLGLKDNLFVFLIKTSISKL